MKRILTSTTFLAILACFLWSTAFAGIKIGLPYTQPLNFAGLRFFLAGLFIVPFTGSIKNYVKVVGRNILFILKISLFQTFILYSLFYTGISMVSGALAAIIVGASPLFASLMAHFMLHNDKMTWKNVSSISAGMIGVVIIALSRGKFSLSEGAEFWGLIILIVANISGNFGNILVVKAQAQKKIPPLILNSSQIMIGGLFILLLSVPVEGFKFKLYPLPYYISLGYLSMLSATAFSIWYILLNRPNIKISYLNIWKFIIPVSGAALSWVLLPDESPETVTVAGMLIICLSLILLNLNDGLKRFAFYFKS